MQHRSRLFWGTLVAGLVLFAFFLRFAGIDSLPAGLYPDEAVNGIDAIAANESGHYRLFYPNNYGREGLFINLQALALKAFGISVPALKLASALFGALAVWGTYLLGRELFHRRAGALAAAFMLATSFWAINFSRIGFRAIMVSFLLSFSFYFFFRGLRRHTYLDFVWSGLFFGLGLHTYIAFRIAPLVLVLLIPFLMLSYEKFVRRYWKHALVFGFSAFVAAAPLLFHFFVSHPEDFASRTGAVSVLSPEVNQGDLWGTLGKTVSLSLIKYNFWGDQNWRHNYPPYPILDPFTGCLFLAGLLFTVYQFFALLWRRVRRGDRDLRLVRNAFLLILFFAMLIPEFLTAEGLPHALRSIGTQVPVFLMAALPVLWLFRKMLHSGPVGRLAVFSFLLLLLLGGAAINIVKYFVFFNESPHQHRAFDEQYTNMAEYLLSLPPETRKYVYANAGGTDIDNGLPVTAQPIAFLTHGRIDNLTFLTPDTEVKGPAVIILMRYDEGIAERLMDRGYERREVDPRPGSGSGFPVFVSSHIKH